MKSYLVHEGDNLDALKSALSQTMPDELFLLRFHPGLSDEGRKVAIELLGKTTRQGCVVLDVMDRGTPVIHHPLISLIQQAGIPNLCVAMDLNPGPAQMGPFEALHHKHPRDRSQTGVDFEGIRGYFKDRFQVFPLVKFQEESQLDVLYPTLMVFADAGIRWVQLEPLFPNYDVAVKIKNTFKMLRMLQRTKLQIQFSYFLENRRVWNSKTDNLFSGPIKLDMDVSNTCTHNCTFCTYYSDAGMEENKKAHGGKLSPDRVKLLAAKLDTDRGMKFLKALPDSVEFIQFGGIGDPYTHPQIDDFIQVARNRGFTSSILTNFSYMDHARLDRLHRLAGPSGWELHYVVNLAASTGETYVKVRPNQTPATFEKVIRHIQYANRLHEADPTRRIGFTLLLVLNKYNFRDMVHFVSLAGELGVNQAWIKPMEIHSDIHKEQLPVGSELEEYKGLVMKSILLADRLGLKLHNRHLLQAMLNKETT
ncbi:MAG: hypothetical protein JNL01_00485 [Bdellovibrionales bacterium]|nr:hypothetical protein [Bdellovibrionales bacterium]